MQANNIFVCWILNLVKIIKLILIDFLNNRISQMNILYISKNETISIYSLNLSK